MGNYRLGLFEWRVQVALFIVVFPIAMVIFTFSSCDVRRRGDKHACRDGSAERCLALGTFYESRTDGIIGFLMSNAKTAKEAYARGCKLGNVTCCARFGHMKIANSYDQALDEDSTHEDGMAALTTACNAGLTDSCRELADALDPAQAVPVLEKLCKAGDKASCAKQVSAVAANDPRAALELAAKQCDAGDNAQCGEVGDALLTGSGDEPARGIALLTKACDRGGWALCTQLGKAYLDGTVPDDGTRGIELVGKSCDHKDDDGCFWLGKAQLATDPAKAMATFEASCSHDPRACNAIGDILRVGVEGYPKDRNRAYEFYKKVCQAGWEFCCDKVKCMNRDDDACYRVHRDEENEVVFRLGGKFDMR